MARPSIEDIRGLGDFMVSNLWEVVISTPTGVNADFDGINFRAISFEIPKRTGNSLEVNIRGAKIRQPGDYDYSGTVTLTLAETENNNLSHTLIQEWREAVIETDTNKQKIKKEVEATATIYRLNRQNEPIAGTWWTLIGVFIEDYDLGELNEEGAVIQPTITLSYDYFMDAASGTGITPPIADNF